MDLIQPVQCLVAIRQIMKSKPKAAWVSQADLWARIEVIKLALVSVGASCAHGSTAVVKRVGLLYGRGSIAEVHSHALLAKKFAVAAVVAPLFGLAEPTWAIRVHRRLSLKTGDDTVWTPKVRAFVSAAFVVSAVAGGSYSCLHAMPPSITWSSLAFKVWKNLCGLSFISVVIARIHDLATQNSSPHQAPDVGDSWLRDVFQMISATCANCSDGQVIRCMFQELNFKTYIFARVGSNRTQAENDLQTVVKQMYGENMPSEFSIGTEAVSPVPNHNDLGEAVWVYSKPRKAIKRARKHYFDTPANAAYRPITKFSFLPAKSLCDLAYRGEWTKCYRLSSAIAKRDWLV